MSRLLRASLFTLVALWLPVTLHCRMEAAGFFEPHDDCATEHAAASGTDCKDDICPTVEDTLFKECTQGLAVAPPAQDARFVRLALAAFAPASDAESPLAPERHAPPPELRVAWQFLSRAAPPVRAPSLHT